MKNLVSSVGDVMFMVPETGELIEDSRPCVVTNSNFVTTRISIGQLKLIAADLPLEASDAEFAEFWAENPEIAVAAYLSTFEGEDLGIPTEDLEAAVALLKPEDFAKDGKPKVGALDALLDGVKVDTEMRDAFWAARTTE